MEDASRKLAELDYPACERLCLQALRAAEQAGDYGRIARLLMPLAEARRQRRQIAVDAGVFIPRDLSADEILQAHRRGCVLLTKPPYTDADEKALRDAALAEGRSVEVLLLDEAGLRAAFLRAMDQRGDAILASLRRDLSNAERVSAILEQLDRIGDHEIAHQRLADAARRAAREAAQSQ